MTAARTRRIVPEVIQTSKTDCGPAALKSILEGFGLSIGYSDLRDLCQTDVDGTSVDRLELVANQVGLDCEQVVVPADHVLLPEARVLPGIVVVRNAAGDTHLVAGWRTQRAVVQVMDPARGRLWMSRRAFVQQLYMHTATVPAAAWRDWAGTADFLSPLTARLLALGLRRHDADRLLAAAVADPSWRGLAALDAGVRLVALLRQDGALDRADEGAALTAFAAATPESGMIPDHCWSVRPAAPRADGEPQVAVRGALVLRVGGVRDPGPSRPTATPTITTPNLLHGVLRLLWSGSRLGHAVLAGALAIAAIGMTFEVLLLRSVLDAGFSMRLPEQRLVLVAALAVFGAALLAVEWMLAAGERRLGAELEGRLRLALLEKMPRLSDRYFASRPVSDMAERSHSVHQARMLPSLAIRFARTAMELLLTTAAIVWLEPALAAAAIAGALAAAAIPLLGHGAIAERDLRQRTHAGALARFQLDALRGRAAIDAHHAARVLEREHDTLLGEWRRAGAALQRSALTVEGLQIAIGFCVGGWLIVKYVGVHGDLSGLLLLLYWSLNLPALAYELALHVREYPLYRNTVLRLLEPLEAAEDARCQTAPSADSSEAIAATGARTGTDVVLQNVTVVGGEQRMLDDVSVRIEAGSHVAIVGPSGAGKSTLISVLLGLHPLAAGTVLADGRPLAGARIDDLRRRTAWVDPAVHIWNQSLLENLLYGNAGAEPIGDALDAAELLAVVTRLPQGLATGVGEGGLLLSAGEAQRTRLGRVFLRAAPSLVLLDEPFRGLERERRRPLVSRVRERWPASTLIYITHDIAEAAAFDRVLVVERGRIVEDGEPHALAQRPASRYRRMLHAHDAVHTRFNSTAEWRRVRFDGGRIVHAGAELAIEQTA